MAHKQLQTNLALALNHVKAVVGEILLPPHLQMPPVNNRVVELERAGFQRLLSYCDNAEPALKRVKLGLWPGQVKTDYQNRPIKTEALFKWAHEAKSMARKIMYYTNLAAAKNNRKTIGEKEITEALCRLKGLDYQETAPLYQLREKKFISHSHYGSWYYRTHLVVGNQCGCRIRHVKAVAERFRCTICGSPHHIDCGTGGTRTVFTTCRREERIEIARERPAATTIA